MGEWDIGFKDVLSTSGNWLFDFHLNFHSYSISASYFKKLKHAETSHFTAFSRLHKPLRPRVHERGMSDTELV
jgi:hypothetical protein